MSVNRTVAEYSREWPTAGQIYWTVPFYAAAAKVMITELLSCRRGTARCAIFGEILSAAAQLYTKNRILKGCIRSVTLKVTQGHRNCHYLVFCMSLSISGL